MTAPGSTHLWRKIALQSIWGKRGLVKTGSLWLPLAFILTVNPPIETRSIWIVCIIIFIATAFRSQASILANDIVDSIDDRAAGKERWIADLSPAAGALVVAVLVVFGGFLLILSRVTTATITAYVFSVALAIFYSISPVCFKKRGVLGPMAYSLANMLAYVVVPWTWLGGNWLSLALLTPAVFLDKWVNLHFHQIVDYEADRSSGIRTFATAAGLPLARRSLGWAARSTSVSILAVLAFLVLAEPKWGLQTTGTCLALAVFAGLYAEISRRRPKHASALVSELPWHYLGLTYTLFRILPLILIARLAIREPTMWVVFGAVILSVLAESWYSVRYRYE